jgi:uncharacterized protein YdeI (YjbR/CyaY-like superfamily)
MNDLEKVEEYLKKHSQWTDQLSTLRAVFLKTELKEEMKWGAPAYTLNGIIVSGLVAFKNHYAIWFHQGVYLKNQEKQLVNAQEGKTKALRQWKFTSESKIDTTLVLKYILESIENSKAGKKSKPNTKKELIIPKLLEDAIQNNNDLKDSFYNLSPGKQRAYADHISSAKREAIQISRLEKITPMIIENKGLYDKYKNC